MKKFLLKSILIGTIAGMRSMSAPALIGNIVSDKAFFGIGNRRLKFLKNSNVYAAMNVLALGEMLADKLPNAPDRIDAPLLTARAISGAACGAAISMLENENKLTGAIIGGAAAIASTFVFFKLRTKADEILKLPDTAVALAEDAVVFGVSSQLKKMM